MNETPVLELICVILDENLSAVLNESNGLSEICRLSKTAVGTIPVILTVHSNASWLLLTGSVSCTSWQLVQPGNAYSCILKVKEKV